MYKVIDEKGIGYSNQDGRRIVIEKGGNLDKKLIDSGLFTQECVDKLVNSGRLGKEKVAEPKKAVAPENKKLETKENKGAKS